MCLTCGCNMAHDDHGDKDYLTVEKLMESEQFKKSADKDKIKPEEAMKNAMRALEEDKKEHPDEY